MTAWRGHLRLDFEARAGRTVLGRREHGGPVAVQRPFHPGDGACHVYMLHPPGGLARDDRLETAVDVRRGAKALLTTPAATKVYRSSVESSVGHCLNVRSGAGLEWLPQETILFGGSRYRARTHIRLAGEARLAAWDIVTLGRPASADPYDTGAAHFELRIDVDGAPRLIERQRWDRAAADRALVLGAPWGLGGHSTLAGYYAYPADADTLDRARWLLGDCKGTGATLLDDLLVVRTLATDVECARRRLAGLWHGLREIVSGLAPMRPRIWAT